MTNVINLTGYENFRNFADNVKIGEKTYFYFSGTKDSSGTSWCSDCVLAEKFVNSALQKYGNESKFVHVDVGDRPTWKDMKNPFRLDKDIHLMVIPTLILWKSPRRLDGFHLEKDDILKMFFEEDDD